ncbi:MAG: hypothetical protein Q4D73_05900 [Actinomycetaceae bacterium]|nr:hypothetical protein [Actinomycetaceae bacterium]
MIPPPPPENSLAESPLSYLPFIDSSYSSHQTYSAILVEPTLLVDSESLFQAAANYTAITEKLECLTNLLQQVSYPPHPVATQMATQIFPLQQALLSVTQRTQALEALLRHAAWLYEEQELSIAGLFPVSWERPTLPWQRRSLGKTTKDALNWAETHLSDDVETADNLLVAFYLYQSLRGNFAKPLKLNQARYSTNSFSAVADGYFFFFTSDLLQSQNVSWQNRLEQEARFRQFIYEKTGSDDLKRSSALLFHIYTTIEKTQGTYLPYLQIEDVTVTPFLANRVVLEREEINYSDRQIGELLAQTKGTSPSSHPQVLQQISAPLTLSQLVERINDLKNRPTAPLAKPDARGNRRAGEIEIIRYQHPNSGDFTSRGRPQNSFSVVMYGTQEWLPGSANPQDMTTNFAAIGGIRTDQEAAVLVALEKAGAQPGDRIEFVGHSQAGLEGAALSVNSEINAKYEVVSVVSAGGPISGFDIPESVKVLSLEHLNDPTPNLDATANPQRKNWLTYSVAGRPVPSTLSTAGAAAYVNHDLTGYLQALRRLETSGDSLVAAHNQERLRKLGITENTLGEVYRFQVMRTESP